MLKEIAVRALGAVEEVFLLALFAFGGAGVGVWIGDFGAAAVVSHVEGVVQCDHGGEGRGREDVAGRKERGRCQSGVASEKNDATAWREFGIGLAKGRAGTRIPWVG